MAAELQSGTECPADLWLQAGAGFMSLLQCFEPPPGRLEVLALCILHPQMDAHSHGGSPTIPFILKEVTCWETCAPGETNKQH